MQRVGEGGNVGWQVVDARGGGAAGAGSTVPEEASSTARSNAIVMSSGSYGGTAQAKAGRRASVRNQAGGAGGSRGGAILHGAAAFCTGAASVCARGMHCMWRQGHKGCQARWACDQLYRSVTLQISGALRLPQMPHMQAQKRNSSATQAEAAGKAWRC